MITPSNLLVLTIFGLNNKLEILSAATSFLHIYFLTCRIFHTTILIEGKVRYMAFSFNPLWKMLIDKEMTNEKLRITFSKPATPAFS